MRDPSTWSLPLGRLFGINVRVHILFFVFALVMWLRTTGDNYPAGAGMAMLVLLTLIFLSVLLHELGHCYAARLVDGDARDILIWPLGGLAFCEVPNTPRANFITAAGGPAVNLLLVGCCAAVLVVAGFWPNFDPRFSQAWYTELTSWEKGGVRFGSEFSGLPAPYHLEPWQVLVAQFFWVNWIGFLINVLLIGFPLDGGRMFQALLWPRLGYRQSMLYAITAGFIVMLIVGIFALWKNEVLILFLALWMYVACKHQWIVLETGGEESLFGYDFSQGYTSLEKDQPPPPRRRRPNFFQRWLQRRAARKLLREQERQLAEEQRMDQLLDKIQRHGKDALTDEEHRFLKRVADKYRNRN
jgi:stage IV sporulation protein FB